MILIDCEQGTEAWEQARIGRPTASCFDKILTPATLKPSKSADEYRNKILAEWVLGMALEWVPPNQWTTRGEELEPRARGWYAFEFGAAVKAVGFVLRDDEKVGGSPDALVGEDGGLEIKCPAIHTHIGYMLDPDSLVAEYKHQVQGNLYLTGRKWWDLVSYHPDLPAVVRTIHPDAAYHAALDAALAVFIEDLEQAKKILEPHRAEIAARMELTPV
jgi:hypothetical protein